MILNDNKLDFWIKQNLNVLMIGKHGVGKSTIVINAFNRNNLRWLYFSAATMDPWVDFIGVPKEQKDEKGNPYLDLVRPKAFQNDEIEAIFMDEFNRSTKKVRNAVMELIQFKSINGKKFNKLRIVWAAINPEDDSDQEVKYDVEKLDPAQKDRFHIQIPIPYKPDLSFFKDKYNIDGENAVEWWLKLEKDIKELISPRRLDYALEVFKKGGDMRDVFCDKVNVSSLVSILERGSYLEKLRKIYGSKDAFAGREFLGDENNYHNVIVDILSNWKQLTFFLPLLSKEKQASLIVRHSNVRRHVLDNASTFNDVLVAIRDSGANRSIAAEISRRIGSGKPSTISKVSGVAGIIEPILEGVKVRVEERLNCKSNRTQNNRMAFADIRWRYGMIKDPDMAVFVFDSLAKIIRNSHSLTIEKKYKNYMEMIIRKLLPLIPKGYKVPDCLITWFGPLFAGRILTPHPPVSPTDINANTVIEKAMTSWPTSDQKVQT